MADLPEDRVTPGEPPFTRTGVDYFGPFLTKHGRSVQKRYGCIFTRLSTRAVYLEMAYIPWDASSVVEVSRRSYGVTMDRTSRVDRGSLKANSSSKLNSDKMNRYVPGAKWY